MECGLYCVRNVDRHKTMEWQEGRANLNESEFGT